MMLCRLGKPESCFWVIKVVATLHWSFKQYSERQVSRSLDEILSHLLVDVHALTCLSPLMITVCLSDIDSTPSTRLKF